MSVPEKVLFKLRVPLLKNLHACVKVLFFVISEFQLAVRHLDLCVSIQEYILSYFTRSYKRKKKTSDCEIGFLPSFL